MRSQWDALAFIGHHMAAAATAWLTLKRWSRRRDAFALTVTIEWCHSSTVAFISRHVTAFPLAFVWCKWTALAFHGHSRPSLPFVRTHSFSLDQCDRSPFSFSLSFSMRYRCALAL